MRDEQRGGAVALEDLAQLRAQLSAQLGVEARERFVEQQQLRTRCERAREGHTLLLAAGKLVRLSRVESGEAHRLDEFLRPCATLRSRPVVQAESDVAEHIEVREQRVVLEHHADAACLRRQLHAGRREHTVVGEHATGVGRLEARDDAQQRGLAAAARAQQAADRPWCQRERDIPQHRCAVEGPSYGIDHQSHQLSPLPASGPDLNPVARHAAAAARRAAGRPGRSRVRAARRASTRLRR